MSKHDWKILRSRGTDRVPVKWPTLKGRLNQPITSRVEAVKQLQSMGIEITETAKRVLARGK